MNPIMKGQSFCMIPWIHLHTTPTGDVMPCCIAKDDDGSFGNTRDKTLEEAINSPRMRKLRLNMLYNQKDKACKQCYAHEKQGVHASSFRQTMNKEYGKYFDDAISNTDSEGRITDFKMRYFDIRFNNICNFKCVTCGSEYSSQWEQENKKYRNSIKIIPKNNRENLVNEILEHVDYIDMAYFAGGEPLITEEHYVILEEFIKQGRTNIRLRYNTNLSNLKFKDKDLLGLWKNFNNGVEIYASIDHFGERAEYIRFGTDWAIVEENLKVCKSLDYLQTTINTVVSIFNYETLGDFYQYLIKNNLYSKKDPTFTAYNMQTPVYMTAQVLPDINKKIGSKKLESISRMMGKEGWKLMSIAQINDAIKWANSNSNWDQHKDQFRKFIQENDKFRSIDFSKTFPELRNLID